MAMSRRPGVLDNVLRGLQQQPPISSGGVPWPAAPAAASLSSHDDPQQGGRHRLSTRWPGAWGDYDLDGYTVLPQVLDKDMMAHCADHLTHLTAKFPSIPTEHLHHVIYRVRTPPHPGPSRTLISQGRFPRDCLLLCRTIRSGSGS